MNALSATNAFITTAKYPTKYWYTKHSFSYLRSLITLTQQRSNEHEWSISLCVRLSSVRGRTKANTSRSHPPKQPLLKGARAGLSNIFTDRVWDIKQHDASCECEKANKPTRRPGPYFIGAPCFHKWATVIYVRSEPKQNLSYSRIDRLPNVSWSLLLQLRMASDRDRRVFLLVSRIFSTIHVFAPSRRWGGGCLRYGIYVCLWQLGSGSCVEKSSRPKVVRIKHIRVSGIYTRDQMRNVLYPFQNMRNFAKFWFWII